MDMRSFLAHAVHLELEAEMVYLHLIDLTKERGTQAASRFFEEMANYSRLHRQTAMKRAGFATLHDVPAIDDAYTVGGETPELGGARLPLDLEAATSLALAAERRGIAVYDQVARSTDDAEIKTLATAFAAEERDHVLALERFMGLKPY